MIVLGILIALSMLLSLFVGLGGRRSSAGNAPLPESERFEAPAEPLGALDVDGVSLVLVGPSTAGPPTA